MNRKLYFTKWNYLIFAAGFVLLLCGYYMMTIGPYDSFWSLTLSPIIIMFSLVVVFPLGILLNFKK